MNSVIFPLHMIVIDVYLCVCLLIFLQVLTWPFNKIFLDFFQPSAPLPHPGTSTSNKVDKQRKAVYVLDSELVSSFIILFVCSRLVATGTLLHLIVCKSC